MSSWLPADDALDCPSNHTAYRTHASPLITNPDARATSGRILANADAEIPPARSCAERRTPLAERFITPT